MPLEIREWQCSQCGTLNDRDVNATKNIRDEGLRILAVGHTVSACGERVRPSKGTAFKRHHSTKQESPVKLRQQLTVRVSRDGKD